jgi:hypothetical protein
VFSDAHYFPGEPSIGHQALLRVIKEVKPVMIVANGDIMDGNFVTWMAWINISMVITHSEYSTSY